MNTPKIYLAMDNCFAYKRWTAPDEWAALTRKLGVRYIEASADTELDPFYMGSEYLKDWPREVQKAEKQHGVKVVNVYSGHGSYTTLGLAHPDKRVRERMKREWFMPLIDIAAQLGAGFGFFAHGFSQQVLQGKDTYDEYVKILYDAFAELAHYAKQVGCGKLGIEQMYSPHQVPWRIGETRDMMRLLKRQGCDFYFTEDVGHHHIKFIKPEREDIEQSIADGKRPPWLGTDHAYRLYDKAVQQADGRQGIIGDIMQDIEEHGYLFSEEADGDCYEWLRQLGCYAPIIHLQQTNGLESSHKYFTKANNELGKIEPGKVLRALQKSYQAPQDGELPPRCDELYLTIEGFFATAAIPEDSLQDCRETVQYWRKAIPEDGLELSELV